MESGAFRDRPPNGYFSDTAVGSPGSRPLKILVADDERHIVRLIHVNLVRQGHEVVTAFDGKEALSKIHAEWPDVVILDVMMPCMDGFEVLKEIRSHPDTRRLPVIMLIARAQDRDVFEGYPDQADLYLAKPFNPLDLLKFFRRK